ncbi:AMP-binding protein [Streptomyces europaeiscabiei]|uniref:AMP-binding protein n=1 Tax=Streptomyces europaeiscabiei TaxID=146819 RepID=UPI0029AAE450|nr:AMP-binding protein [Streptomyces europaeiscabiei]MDX3696405.1 AMP-binding protein [Streptomyces europaeiscabiei]
MTIQSLIHQHALRTPGHLALSGPDGTLTYRQLDAAAEAVATRLRSLPEAGDVIFVDLDSSVRRVAVLLGVLRSGRAYAVADPGWPEEVLAEMTELLGVRLTVTDAADEPGTWAPPPIGELRAAPVASAPEPGDDDAPACLLFTSGTTGTPKAVLCPHRGVIRMFHPEPLIGFANRPVVPQLAQLQWDMGNYELWGALISGGTALLTDNPYTTPDLLTRMVKERGADNLFLTTALFNLLVDEGVGCFSGLAQVMAGGERVSVPHMGRFLDEHPDIRLICAYGPVENSMLTTVHTVQRHDLEDPLGIPIGVAVPGTEIFVLDDDGKQCPAGEAGELYTGGAGVALGYVGRPELVAERFVDLEVQGAVRRLYRTGDKCLMGHDGLLRFIGRTDRQVKIRGQRIELDGVEAALGRLPGVRTVAVRAIRDQFESVVSLMAYYVTDPEGPTDAATLARTARATMPSSHVPARFRQVESMPMTERGKVDYKALEAL